MRFLILVHDGTHDAPPAAAMVRWREELSRAGALLDAAGSELLIDVRSIDEARAWVQRFATRGVEFELREHAPF